MEEKMTTTTRFICIDSRDEYSIRWFTKIMDTNPVFNKNGKLSFAIIGSKGRMEINTLDMNYLETKYDVWVAQYNTECTYEGRYDIWQYTSEGSISGISGNVDCNWFYKKY